MENTALLTAIRINADGSGVMLEPATISAELRQSGLLWLNFDYSHPDTEQYLRDVCRLDAHVVKALIAAETRPSSFVAGDGLLLVLRGLNLNPGADPVDMVSVRCWLEPQRIITSRNRQVMALNDLRESLSQGTGPKSTAEFLVRLCDRLTHRMAVVFEDIEEAEDEIEERILEDSGYRLRPLLGQLRRKVIGLRRYLSPQRQAVYELQSEPLSWLADERPHLREIADRITRQVEDLDATRDRAAIAQDELESKLSEQLNKNMYLLSVVAAVFLPLGLIAGLLGINVKGIPGAENPQGFLVVCLMLFGIAGLELWLLRRLRFL